jgi:peptidoglycan glycosyltransferase
LNTRRNIRTVIIVFTVMFSVLLIYMAYAVNTYGNRWFTNVYNPRLEQQRSNVVAGSILDRNGVVLAETNSDGERVYNSNDSIRTAVSHVVGDNLGLTTAGVESFFAQYLLGFNESIIERLYQTLSGSKRYGSNVVTTIDAKLCAYASDVMGSVKGAVVVLNYKTGEILCMVSHPTFDPNDIEQYLKEDAEDTTALVNRAVMGRYTPGSVFKIVTASAAIRNISDINTRKYDCVGPLVFDATTKKYLENIIVTAEQDTEENAEIYKDYLFLRDYAREYHGERTFSQAFASSCNTTFGRIGMQVGSGLLLRMAESLGFNEDFVFDEVMLYPSSFEAATTDVNVAWSAVGQYTDIVTPLHMCMITAAIANDGVMMEPKIMKRITNARGYQIESLKPEIFKTPLSASEAEQLRELMYGVVKSGTGTSAKISGYKVGGKTGTAEITGEDGKNTTNAWFTSFIYDEDHPLAIAIVLENGSTGGKTAAPAAAKILKKAIEYGY